MKKLQNPRQKSNTKLAPAQLLENETKLMEKKLEDLQKSIQRDKNVGRWINNENNGLNSNKYSRLIRSKKNIMIDERKAKGLNDLSISTATSNKSKIDENIPRGRKLSQSTENDQIIPNDSFLSNEKMNKKTYNIQIEELKSFQTKCGQGMYLDKFIDNGFDDMDVLVDIESTHLSSMGIKPGHQIKLKKQLSEYSKINKSSENFNNFDSNSIKSNNSIRIRVTDRRLDSAKQRSQNTSQINLNASTQSFETNSVKINKIEMLDTQKNFGSSDIDKTDSIDNLEPQMTKSYTNVYIPLDDEFDYMSESQYTQRSDTLPTKNSVNNKPNCNLQSEKTTQLNNVKKYNIQEKRLPSKDKIYEPIVKIDEKVEIIKEGKDYNMQTECDMRAKFCYNCFKCIDNNVNDGPITVPDFKDQVFCSKKCVKIQYLENSTFCKNEDCEKGHFIKYQGVLVEGLWYCSCECHLANSQYKELTDTLSNSKRELMDIDRETLDRMRKDHDSLEPINYHLEEIEKDSKFLKDDVSIDSFDEQDDNDIDLDLDEIKSFVSIKIV